MAERSIAIRVDEETFRKIKARATSLGITLKEYIVSLANEDIQKAENSEDDYFPPLEKMTREQFVQLRRMLEYIQIQMFGDSGMQ
nr:MAG TPA: N-acetyltransferase [Caudoviricetes sp.]